MLLGSCSSERWSRVQVKYVLAYTACGPMVRFWVIPRPEHNGSLTDVAQGGIEVLCRPLNMMYAYDRVIIARMSILTAAIIYRIKGLPEKHKYVQVQCGVGRSLILQVAAQVPPVEKHVGPHNQPQLNFKRVDDLNKLYQKLRKNSFKHHISSWRVFSCSRSCQSRRLASPAQPSSCAASCLLLLLRTMCGRMLDDPISLVLLPSRDDVLCRDPSAIILV